MAKEDVAKVVAKMPTVLSSFFISIPCYVFLFSFPALLTSKQVAPLCYKDSNPSLSIINANPKRNHSLIQRIILNVKQNEERTILVSF
ncbi:hypothetical protein VDIAB_270685 [Vibrio diabolicus]|nr:hypothetical protein VDIAB_270685 [Vibrio diabolicus]